MAGGGGWVAKHGHGESVGCGRLAWRHTGSCVKPIQALMQFIWINLTKRENYRGCVSENLCPVDEDTVQLSSLLGARVKCCHGELCNSARRTGQLRPPTLLALLASITLLRLIYSWWWCYTNIELT
uniref:UPAR/Ly6 domain-containing protein n=1 Tax=Paramormyrops kingsleyae TaxID=1676925 RepID=A0A3B3SFP9_9TELE